jgi:ribonucleotide reductase alpha subunit
VTKCLHFLDAVRNRFIYFNDEMRRVSEREARLGLGIMGFADLLKRLSVRYGSDESFDWAHTIGRSMQVAAD